MNKRTKKLLQRLSSALLAIIIMLGSVDMRFVKAEQAAITEKTWQTERCIITYTLTDHWDTGYTATVNVQNVSDETIENWHVLFSEKPQVVDLWNAQIVAEKDAVVFKNVGWNQDIAAGSNISFGYTANSCFQGFPEIAELAVSEQIVPQEDFEIMYQVRDDWTTGYVGNIVIHNKLGRTIEDWMLSFSLPYEINDIWNGQIVSYEDGKYLIKNKTDNQNITTGQMLEIGFTVNGGNASELPTDFCLMEYTLTEGSGMGNMSVSDGDPMGFPQGGSQGESGEQDKSQEEELEKEQADVSGNDVSGGDVHKDILLTIDTDSFDLNEKLGMYLTKDEVTVLFGGLRGAERIDSLTYSITDLYGLVVKSDEIDVRERWKISEMGLVLGLNRIKVTAVSKAGEIFEKEIFLMNFNMDNMKHTDVDMGDTDGDGIENYFEGIFGTDPALADTDGDGLTDREELFLIGTDPLKVDTDDNRVSDGQEDFDEDGLNNLEEMEAGTGVYYPDTDGDGLNDGEEVRQYHTNPLVPDTDEDGLLDGQDVKLGFGPLNPDTDGDGIWDGGEVVYQTYTKELDQERKAGVTQVSVSMDCAGYLDDQVWIQNAYNLDMRSTNLVGLFGAPVIIESETDFDEAVITFTYDENALGEIPEDNLRIMWYDEENDIYHLLDDESVLDTENNTISCTTTHFSPWMLVDRMAWIMSTAKDIGYSESENSQTIYYDFVSVYNAIDAEGINDTQWRLLGKPSIYGYWAAFEGKSIYGNGSLSSLEWKKTENKYLEDTTALDALDIACTQMSSTHSQEREIFFSNIKDIEYSQALVEKAKTNHIKINCSSTSPANANMQRMALETGGKYTVISALTYQAVGMEMGKAIDRMIPKGSGNHLADTDGDGLPDIYEMKGIRISNGEIRYLNPNLTDTDQDGINDFIEIGGLPKKETYTIGGETIETMVSRGGIYDTLSPDFIYVDGRVNEDGRVIDEKMDYVSCYDVFHKQKYEELCRVDLWDDLPEEKKWVSGVARAHGLYSYKMDDPVFALWAYSYYIPINVDLLIVISKFVNQLPQTENSAYCFYTYIKGEGGSDTGYEKDVTREYVPINIKQDWFGLNSIATNYEDNMREARYVAESVLNEYNTDMYISLSHSKHWSGCKYMEGSNPKLEDLVGIIAYPGIWGTFNEADATATMHFTYDPLSRKYTMEYIYYLVDFYDFPKEFILQEEDALGIARSYELFGRNAGDFEWSR